MVATNNELSRKLEKLEEKYNSHDVQIKEIFEAIRYLVALPNKKKNPIGF